MLNIKDLHVSIENKEIVKGLSLTIKENEIHVLMGQNGSGKSTLAQTLMGNPHYTVTDGNITFNQNDLLALEPHERSQAGLFLSFQYPSEITGVTISSFLRMIYNKHHEKPLSPPKFRTFLIEKMALLTMKDEFSNRYLNEGFSGGEKKRMEMLQMLIIEPKLAILDETDSGLDIDALKVVAQSVNTLHAENNMSVLLITHYSRILDHIQADQVHIMKAGTIIKSGNHKLAYELEKDGYTAL